MKLFLAFLVALFSVNAYAEKVPIKGGDVTFEAESTSGILNISGHGATPQGWLEAKDGKLSGVIEILVKPLTTDNKMRDEHMHEKYLQTEKFPKIKLVLDPVVAGTSQYKWTGKLTIKGDTHAVAGTAQTDGTVTKAEFKINLDDFPSVGVPSAFGVTVAKEVDIKVKLKAEK